MTKSLSLQEIIKNDLVKVAKETGNPKKELLKVLLSEISRYKNADGIQTKEVPDAEVLKIIKKMRDNAIECKNRYEVLILEDYLPQMLNETEIKDFIKQAFISEGFSTRKDVNIGTIMQYIRQSKLASQIDNNIASKIVKEMLQ